MNRIAQLRKDKGYTQRQLADYLRIAQNTLSQYESETRNITANIINRLAYFFGVSPNYLLCLEDINSDVALDKAVFTDKLQNVSQVLTIFSTFDSNFTEELNLYLDLGWKIINIGSHSTCFDNGTCDSVIVYTLGWHGNPENVPFVNLAPRGDEYVSYGFDQ